MGHCLALEKYIKAARLGHRVTRPLRRRSAVTALRRARPVPDGRPSRHVTSHPGQLSLAIPLRAGAVCTSLSIALAVERALNHYNIMRCSTSFLFCSSAQEKGCVKEPNILIYFFFSHLSLNVFYFRCSVYRWKGSVRF